MKPETLAKLEAVDQTIPASKAALETVQHFSFVRGFEAAEGMATGLEVQNWWVSHMIAPVRQRS